MKFIFLILKEFTETYVSYVSKYFRIGGLLNKLFKINGYVTRKNYGELGFKTIKSTVQVSKTEKRLVAIAKALNQIIITMPIQLQKNLFQISILQFYFYHFFLLFPN